MRSRQGRALPSPAQLDHWISVTATPPECSISSITSGDLKAAEDRFHDLRELAVELGDGSYEARASLSLAWLMLRGGYPYQAKPHLDRALELDRHLDDRVLLQVVIAWFAYEQGNFRLAVRTQQELKQQKPEIWRPLDEEFLQVYRRALAAGERFPVPGEREYRATIGAA